MRRVVRNGLAPLVCPRANGIHRRCQRPSLRCQRILHADRRQSCRHYDHLHERSRRGTKVPSLTILLRISRAFKVSIAELLRVRDVDGDHRGIKSSGEITEGEEHACGNVAGFGPLDQRDPTNGTTIRSDDIGHPWMIRACARCRHAPGLAARRLVSAESSGLGGCRHIGRTACSSS